jgi:hypothetical protein
MVEYTYNFMDFRVINLEGDLSKVVKQITWQFVGTEGDNLVSVPFTTTLDDPDSELFIDYENITKEQAIEWVNAKVDIEHIKSNIQDELYKKQSEPKIQSLPFSN